MLIKYNIHTVHFDTAEVAEDRLYCLFCIS